MGIPVYIVIPTPSQPSPIKGEDLFFQALRISPPPWWGRVRRGGARLDAAG